MTSTPDKSRMADSGFKLIKMPRSASREEKRAKILEELASLGMKPKCTFGAMPKFYAQRESSSFGYADPLSDDEVIALFNSLDAGLTPQEAGYLKGYRSAPNKSEYLQNLLDDAVEEGEQLELHVLTFNLEDNSHLAEICPDGECGYVALVRFLGLFFVHYVQFGECFEKFGPWSNMKDATQAFEETVVALRLF